MMRSEDEIRSLAADLEVMVGAGVDANDVVAQLMIVRWVLDDPHAAVKGLRDAARDAADGIRKVYAKQAKHGRS